MKCCHCKRNIAAGADAQKAIVEYVQPDGSTKVFGYMMVDGPLRDATGQIVRAWHHKCFHVQRKREARGDAVTGRVLSGMPTGYQIAELTMTRDDLEALGLTVEQAKKYSTAHLSDKLDVLRAIATDIGKAVGDPHVQEAYAASTRGGPYPHEHHLRLDTYQLLGHLKYAHGATYEVGPASAQLRHDELHAQKAVKRIQADRAEDAGHADPPERDWRDQAVTDI